jgi:hypothetical protein
MPVIKFGENLYKDEGNMPWLGGYCARKLIELYNIGNVIPENNNEQFIPYIEGIKQNYSTLLELNKFGEQYPKLLTISNYGNIKFNDIPLNSAPVWEGPRKGIYGGIWDKYLEINIPGIYTIQYCFLVHRLVAEVWCENPNCYKYDTVHHIGNDNENNSKNLIFLTDRQHDIVHGKFIENII